MSAEANYNQVLVKMHRWHDQMRETGQKYHSTSASRSREIYQHFRMRVGEIFPVICQSVGNFYSDRDLVFPDSPVDSFHNSPYARIYVGLLSMNKILMLESLCQGQYIRELPEPLMAQLPSALRQVEALPTPQPPQLHPETICNLAVHPMSDALGRNRLPDKIMAWYNLLKRPLVSKYFHRGSDYISLGYNRWALHICDAGLRDLDILASCTPWQMRRDPTDYHRRLAATSFDFTRNAGLEDHSGPRQMFSDEFANDDYAGEWETFLETGVLPVKMTTQNINTEPDE